MPDKLIDDLDTVDYIPAVATQQKNWIGRSYGAQVRFATTAGDELEIFTTRPDTLFGATYMVMAPEHAFIEKWKDKLTNYDEIIALQRRRRTQERHGKNRACKGKNRR